MEEVLFKHICVNLFYDPASKKCEPTYILWDKVLYKVQEIGFRHKYRVGNVLFHSFSLSASPSNKLETVGGLVGSPLGPTVGQVFFKIVFDTTNLTWFLEDMHDPEFR